MRRHIGRCRVLEFRGFGALKRGLALGRLARLNRIDLFLAQFSAFERASELAEGVRFELTREQSPLPVFKTGALNHSATLPSFG
jgi:hypothetical protein